MCIVGKSWDYHVLEALRTTLDEGVAMVADSVAFLRAARARGVLRRRALLRRLRRNPEFSLRVLEGAAAGRRRAGSCCATPTAARLPHEVERIVREVVDYFGGDVGVGVPPPRRRRLPAWPTRWRPCAGARSRCRARINGYGERTGNCNLTTIIPNLTLKMGIETIPADRLERLTPVAHHVAELVNMALNPQAPYVGVVGVRPQGRAAHQRDRPAPRRLRARRPGLRRQRHPLRRVASWRAGARCTLKAKELGLDLDGPQLNDVVDTLKRMEHDGYHFEVADASLELLMRRADGLGAALVRGRSRSGSSPTTTARHAPACVTTEATIKVHVGGERMHRRPPRATAR